MSVNGLRFVVLLGEWAKSLNSHEATENVLNNEQIVIQLSSSVQKLRTKRNATEPWAASALMELIRILKPSVM